MLNRDVMLSDVQVLSFDKINCRENCDLLINFYTLSFVEPCQLSCSTKLDKNYRVI